MQTAAENRWEHFPHEADMGVRGIGRSPAAAFEQAALALMHVITDPARVAPVTAVEIDCEAPDLEFLLVEWLNSLIYEMATRRMLFHDFTVDIDGTHCRATARGETMDPGRHEAAVEAKGATLTALHVGRGADGMWHAECVVDV